MTMYCHVCGNLQLVFTITGESSLLQMIQVNFRIRCQPVGLHVSKSGTESMLLLTQGQYRPNLSVTELQNTIMDEVHSSRQWQTGKC